MSIEGRRCNLEHPCGGDFYCTGGVCRQLEGKGPSPCKVNADCPQVPVALVCLTAQGVCLACIDKADCGAGVCKQEKAGEKFIRYCVNCIDNKDCNDTHFCGNEVCRACDSDTQCDQGWACHSGQCTQNLNDGAGNAQ